MTDTNLVPDAAPSDATDDPDAAVAPRYRRSTRQRAAALALPAIFLGIIAVFTALRPDTFGTTANLQTILLTQSVPAIFAIAVLLPLVVGEMDLSVGATLGLGLIVVAGAPGALGLSAWQSVVLALVATTVVGVLNGFLVAYVGINALVATLAVGSVLGGLSLWFTNGAVIIEDFPVAIGWMSSTVSGVPVPLIVLIVVATIAWYFLEHTTTGRYFYALGGSKEASRLAGLNVRRLTLLAFAAAGLIAGLAGVVQASLLGAVARLRGRVPRSHHLEARHVQRPRHTARCLHRGDRHRRPRAARGAVLHRADLLGGCPARCPGGRALPVPGRVTRPDRPVAAPSTKKEVSVDHDV